MGFRSTSGWIILPKWENESYECPLGAPKQSDGGYFENYGASTALELAWAARNIIRKKKGMSAVNLIIIQISSDPTK